ncbi:unnamed protein product [Mytilus edulis]|uniref:Tyr recombinase domain-containing protein n=1 Tax=Mytilus edulis TaxID=6550 RepID=A0A8S3QR92_MYTED|nr:unnamed protein product [Mytilus edulis]
MPRTSTLENLNGDHASTVGRTNTGELTAPSKTTRQQHQTKETSFVKDEYNFDISSLDNESAQNFTHDYYEYEQDGTDIIVKGRLKENIQFWIDIGAYDYIIDTIRDGYKIPFYSIPPSTYLFNNLSALKNSDFVHTAIQDLLHRGLIVQCDQRPFVVNPLTVSVQSNLKKRLILDLRAVNKHLWKQSVKFEDMRTAQQHIKLNYSMFKPMNLRLIFLPPALHTNVDVLMDLLCESKADSTVKTYHAGFIRWKKWAVHNGISRCDILPAKSLHVALYLSSLVQNSHTASPVISAFYSIQWAHRMIGQTSPTENLAVKNVLEGAKRRLATRIEKKEPVTPEILSKMYSSSFKEYNVMSQRFICACLLAYSGFLRVSELLNIRRCDIIFELGYISIFIPKSKTDIYRDGNSVVIACMDSDMCPVKNLKLYLLWADISPESEEFIFRNLTKFKDRYVLRKENKPLSYTLTDENGGTFDKIGHRKILEDLNLTHTIANFQEEKIDIDTVLSLSEQQIIRLGMYFSESYQSQVDPTACLPSVF